MIRYIIRLWRDREDKSLRDYKLSNTVKFAGFDEAKGAQARRRAQARAAELRKINDAYGPHRTDVVRLDTRRAK